MAASAEPEYMPKLRWGSDWIDCATNLAVIKGEHVDRSGAAHDAPWRIALTIWRPAEISFVIRDHHEVIRTGDGCDDHVETAARAAGGLAFRRCVSLRQNACDALHQVQP
jgi:hypothetical protein